MLTRVLDRTGRVWAELTWADGALVALRVPGATVHGDISPHPVLGPVHAITDPDGQPLTEMSRVDWARPTELPAIAAPARLPPGAGGVILDVLARLALAAGVPALRYAGPYPTSALYHSLLRSFTTTATEVEFTADAMDRAIRGARDPLPFDFVPAPHERVSFDRGHAEVRAELERAVIDGVTYARGEGIARLVEEAPHLFHAEVWFGDAVYARVATFSAGRARTRTRARDTCTCTCTSTCTTTCTTHEHDPGALVDGSLVDGPHAIPPLASPVVGKAFPPELVAGLAKLVAEAAPAVLADDAHAMLAASTIRWADLGARVARRGPEGFEVHAALWERVPRARLVLALVEALGPVVAQAVVADVGLMSRAGGAGPMIGG